MIAAIAIVAFIGATIGLLIGYERGVNHTERRWYESSKL